MNPQHKKTGQAIVEAECRPCLVALRSNRLLHARCVRFTARARRRWPRTQAPAWTTTASATSRDGPLHGAARPSCARRVPEPDLDAASPKTPRRCGPGRRPDASSRRCRGSRRDRALTMPGIRRESAVEEVLVLDVYDGSAGPGGRRERSRNTPGPRESRRSTRIAPSTWPSGSPCSRAVTTRTTAPASLKAWARFAVYDATPLEPAAPTRGRVRADQTDVRRHYRSPGAAPSAPQRAGHRDAVDLLCRAAPPGSTRWCSQSNNDDRAIRTEVRPACSREPA